MNKFERLQDSFKATSPDMFAVILLICVVAGVIIIFIIINFIRKKYNWDFSKQTLMKRHNFYSLGHSVGLENFEIKILLDLVKKFNIKYPLTCFTNAKVLDEVIKKGLFSIENDKNLDDTDKVNESSTLLEIKVKIEKNSRKNTGIRTTHLIVEDQKMVIFARDYGYFYVKVTRNFNDYLVIKLLSQKINKQIFSKGDFLKIYFWREEDAGYTFKTVVRGLGGDVRSYHINHSDSLVRTQKRKYRRIPVNIPGEVYPSDVKVIKGRKKLIIKSEIPLKTNIANLSAGGLLMIMDEVNFKEKIIKIDFKISSYKVTGIGKMIRIHDTETNEKEITVQFIKLSLDDKNRINKYVYNYMPGYV